MGFINIRDVGAIGVIKDIDPSELPPNAWSDALNARFEDRIARRAWGEEKVKGTPTVAPYFLMPSYGNVPIFAYTNMDKWYAVDAGVHADITRAVGGDYTGTVDDRWSFTWLNGVAFLTNGVDTPQAWNPIGTGQRLINLTNWPASTTAKVIASIKNYVVAFDVTKSGTRYPTLAKWSDITLPGAIPPSWDETDPTTRAGEFPVSVSPGPVVDAFPLRERLLVCKEGSLHLMTWVGGNDVFRFDAVDDQQGILAMGCAQEIRPNVYAMLTNELNMIITNGGQGEVIPSYRLQDFLQGDINEGSIDKAYVVADRYRHQLMVCYPSGAATVPDKMLVWDWKNDTWSLREMTPSYDAQTGFDQDSSGNMIPGQRALFADHVGTELHRLGTIDEIEDATFTMTLERTGLAVAGQGPDGSPRVDPDVHKMLSQVRPVVSAGGSTTINIYVGATNDPQETPTYKGPYAFDPSTDQEVDTDLVEGKYLAVKFVCSDATQDFRFIGYSLNVQLTGRSL